MIDNKKIICIIPARLESTRFPRKVLALLGGKPLLQWIWEAASKISFLDEVAFAIDSEETAQVIEKFGGRYYMTSPNCLSGTDRLVELQVRGAIHGDIWINWQGDGPFISEKILQDLLAPADEEGVDVWTLKTSFLPGEEVSNSDYCKVVCDYAGNALYFSRSCIPHYRDSDQRGKNHFKHVGLYAFSAEGLRKISEMKTCELEMAEKLEQLRFLFYGLKIRVSETRERTIEIDLPEHLVAAEEHIKRYALI